MTDPFHASFYVRLADAVRARSDRRPRVAVLLGTGLGGVASAIEEAVSIPFNELPGMPRSTAAHHAGEVVLGRLAGVDVIAFSGRLHCYEGYSAAEVVVPIRLARQLGADILMMGSAVGGLDPAYALSDIVVLEDHINLMGVNPLVGPNDDAIGPRWPDMIEPYDRQLIKRAKALAIAAGWSLHQGVYVGVLGPNLETRAEYRMLRSFGADLVGMSTVPETIAAVHAGMRVAAFGIVTDLCLPDALEPVDIQRIVGAANAAEPVLSRLIRDLIADCARGETA